ncbi:hypothetical protein SCB71_14275 [Herbiconiux sp. KACC 21604]|uniref:hypothetical protein n=1 Tax=unclassified Herbiconiux TaxID=2618217 RepID=UPI0014909201|nr:hypothetical protein [Herbiconiux sp. SALV-R1]QJU54308.1 hypothetical protein HL652_12215 [Herbiconiux sp. SALV-R1]WPO85378.1 hypothetical protein SCB71_14275 [Herbiconiux sp. KACC 21604]
MKRLAGFVISLMAVAVLAGCSGAKSYDTPSQLLDAFVAAGGTCDDPQDVMEAMVGEGAHAVLCPENIDMLIVFDSADQKNRYVAQVASEESPIVAGERWVVVSDKAEDLAGSLGGEVVAG